jgi:hypothetical protein
MKVIVKNDRYNLFWITVFTIAGEYVGKFRTVTELKRIFPHIEIIKNYSYDQEY